MCRVPDFSAASPQRALGSCLTACPSHGHCCDCRTTTGNVPKLLPVDMASSGLHMHGDVMGYIMILYLSDVQLRWDTPSPSISYTHARYRSKDESIRVSIEIVTTTFVGISDRFSMVCQRMHTHTCARKGPILASHTSYSKALFNNILHGRCQFSPQNTKFFYLFFSLTHANVKSNIHHLPHQASTEMTLQRSLPWTYLRNKVS